MITETGALSSKTASILISLMYIPFVTACNYFNISSESLGILAILLVIDYMTGIAKTYVINKEDIRSYRAIAGIIAKVSVLLVPITLAVAAKQINYDLSAFVDTVISMLVLAEVYSIIGNIRSIQSGKPVYEIDAVSFVLGKVSNMIEELLRKGR